MTDRSIAQQHRLHHMRTFVHSGISQRAYCPQPYTPCRTTLAKWLQAYRRGGPDALLSGVPKPCPHNRTCLQDEVLILEYVKLNLGHGAQRIANELRGRICVGHNGVHGVLKRHGLNHLKPAPSWPVTATYTEVLGSRMNHKT